MRDDLCREINNVVYIYGLFSMLTQCVQWNRLNFSCELIPIHSMWLTWSLCNMWTGNLVFKPAVEIDFKRFHWKSKKIFLLCSKATNSSISADLAASSKVSISIDPFQIVPFEIHQFYTWDSLHGCRLASRKSQSSHITEWIMNVPF